VADVSLERLRAVAELAGVDVSRGSPPRREEILANRLTTAIARWGNPRTPTVMFLHGGNLTGRTWDLVCMALSDRFDCVVPDLRGHGDTAWPTEPNYTLDDFGADIASIIDVLGLRAVSLVGMSMGGLIALDYATRHRELVSLALIDVAPTTNSHGRSRIRSFTSQQRFGSLDDAVEAAFSFNPRRKRDVLRHSLKNNLRQHEDGSWTWKWDPRRVDQGGVRGVSDVEALWNVVGQISCPTLVVRGGDSDVLLESQAIRLRDSLQNGTLATVPRAGHTVQGDNPAGLLEVLEPFLSAHTADVGAGR
jgi:pimeloyl-ACP methyl ester carboxylesterase